MRQPPHVPASNAPSLGYLAVLTVLAGVFLACGVWVTGAGALFEVVVAPPETTTSSTTTPSTTGPSTTVPSTTVPSTTGAPVASEAGIAEVEGGPDDAPPDP